MISVIIPTLNEASSLPAVIARVRRDPAPQEILVVDAASLDKTAEVAKALACQVIAAPRRQRAHQMNLGASCSRGDVLLFLHADTLLPVNALQRIAESLHSRQVVGGAFARRFDSRSRLLAMTCLVGELRSRWLGWFLGDQGIFVRRSVFETLQGFREIDLFEDLDFSRRMRRLGKVLTIRPRVISSARRFNARGPLATSLSDLRLLGLYFFEHR